MKLTANDLAAALGVYVSSAKELLDGTIRIKYSEIEEIAEYYGVTPDEIMHCNCGMRLALRVK